MSPKVNIIAIFSDFLTYFLIESNFNSKVTLTLTFSESFFEQNVSVELNLLRFFCFDIKPEMRDVLGKMRECGKYAKMLDFPHDCGTCGAVDTYMERSAERVWNKILSI